MTFAKFRRQSLGLTLVETAAKARLTPSEISLIERRRLRPSEHQLRALAGALGISRPERLLYTVTVDDAAEVASS